MPRPSATRGIVFTLLAFIAAGNAHPVTGQGQQPRFEAAVARVAVDVIVRADRRFVDDLTVEDFRVFEDGVPVRVISAEMVDLSETSAGALNPAAARATVASVRDEPPAAAARGAMVFLIDTPSLSNSTKLRFVDAWAQLLESTSVLGLPRAVYAIDYAGDIIELAALGSDNETLARAATAVRQLAITNTRRADQLIELASALPSLDAGGGALTDPFGQPLNLDVATRPAAARARVFEDEERRRTETAIESLAAVCDALWAVEGRTTLVWVSSGVPLMQAGPSTALLAAFEDAAQRAMSTPSAELVPGIRRLRADLSSPDLRIAEQLERLFEAANSANVSIYGIDPTLLVEARMPGVDAGVGSGGFRRGLSDPLVLGTLDALGDSLRNTAEATGGRAYVHATDLAAALREIEAEASRYYMVAYAPPRPQPDGGYHEIRVEVSRAGASVRARRGYRHLSEAQREARDARAAGVIPGLAAAVAARARQRAGERQVADTPEATAAPSIDEATPAATGRDADAPGATPGIDPAVETAASEADQPQPADLERLTTTLARLAETANAYRAAALTFTCDETVIASTYNSAGDMRRRAVWELEYIYTFEESPQGAPQGSFRRLRDYRVKRDPDRAPGDEVEEVRLADLDLPVATMRAYSWAFLFQRGLQAHYRFTLTGADAALGREALVIAFEPVAPVVEGFNDWFGRAWVDAETYQVLRIEALQAGDYYELDAIEKDRVTLNVPRDGRLVVRLEAEFAIEERGIRLPSKVTLTGEDYSMRSLGLGLVGGISSSLPEWRLKGRAAFRVEQIYDNYRFFNVEVR